MSRINSILCRRILNSHVKFTNEFEVQLEDGSRGVGSSPLGETTSIYERQSATLTSEDIIKTLKRDGILNAPINQISYDRYLLERVDQFGRSNVFSLSVAFFNAVNTAAMDDPGSIGEEGKIFFPISASIF